MRILISAKCDDCDGLYKILQKSYDINKRNHNGQYICRSCSARRRNNNPEYLASIHRSGKEHWAYGLTGELSPSFGSKRTSSTKRKISNSKKRRLPCGLTTGQVASRKAAETRRRDDSYRTGSLKAAITKDKNNTWVTYSTEHYNGLYYRSSTERLFLEWQEQLGNFSNITNCNFTISYKFGGRDRRYVPDFFDRARGVIFEIKSCWTWDKKGSPAGEELKKLNKAKLLAARLLGYQVVLVIYKQLPSGRYSDPDVYNHDQIKDL